MKQSRVRTLEGIAHILGTEGFKQYAKDYGNSRVSLDDDTVDTINLIESYQDDDKLIAHFYNFRETIESEYTTNHTPFYKANAFKEQNEKEIKEFGYISSM